MVNYIDRITLSIAAPQLSDAFHLSAGEMGILFSAFSWTYALLQIPAGMVLDRFGVTRVGRWGTALWALASAATAMTTGFVGLLSARLMLGVAEAPGLSLSAKATGYWFPRKERALATAIFDASAKFANVIGVPLIAIAVVSLGWRWGFGISAVLSLLYFVGFFALYRDPTADKRLDPAELAYIQDGGSAPEGEATADAAGMLGYLLTNVKVWGLTIGYVAYDYAFYLFLTWLPSYLVQTMHMSIMKSAAFTVIPWGFATLTDTLIGGWLIDHLIGRGRDESRVRKAILVLGLVMALAVIGVTQTTDPIWAIVWITISLGGLSIAGPVTWSMPSLIAPKGGVGTVAGIMNCVGNVAGAVAPIATGFIVGATHSFSYAFWVAGTIIVIGILSILFVMGPVEAVPEPRKKSVQTGDIAA
ncbi:MFS transporter [Robbsia sp. KACC 23696]|uniref:MFS transporter n=1 Tax=Robbsia sp. KACC 23696 TaxID=3149231 RepID=UPI00325B8693